MIGGLSGADLNQLLGDPHMTTVNHTSDDRGDYKEWI